MNPLIRAALDAYADAQASAAIKDTAAVIGFGLLFAALLAGGV